MVDPPGQAFAPEREPCHSEPGSSCAVDSAAAGRIPQPDQFGGGEGRCQSPGAGCAGTPGRASIETIRPSQRAWIARIEVMAVKMSAVNSTRTAR